MVDLTLLPVEALAALTDSPDSTDLNQILLDIGRPGRKLNVGQLKKLCLVLQLPASGSKPDLLARLTSYTMISAEENSKPKESNEREEQPQVDKWSIPPPTDAALEAQQPILQLEALARGEIAPALTYVLRSNSITSVFTLKSIRGISRVRFFVGAPDTLTDELARLYDLAKSCSPSYTDGLVLEGELARQKALFGPKYFIRVDLAKCAKLKRKLVRKEIQNAPELRDLLTESAQRSFSHMLTLLPRVLPVVRYVKLDGFAVIDEVNFRMTEQRSESGYTSAKTVFAAQEWLFHEYTAARVAGLTISFGEFAQQRWPLGLAQARAEIGAVRRSAPRTSGRGNGHPSEERRGAGVRKTQF